MADLRYCSDEEPGISRRGRGRGFEFFDDEGRKITDEQVIERCKALAIPPAWSEVWICLDPDGHLQATGRDQKGRKQYRYHDDYRAMQERKKFDRMREFGAALPGIRERVDADLRRHGLPRERVLACAVALLDLIHLRIGSEEYAGTNKTYGLATLRKRHADIGWSKIRLTFRGKGSQKREYELTDRRLARILSRMEELQGQELFTYLDDDGSAVDVKSGDVNDYLREISGGDFTAKDFRTWGGSILALECLMDALPDPDERKRRRQVNDAIRRSADGLQNTLAVCKASYVHPAIQEGFLNGGLGVPPPNDPEEAFLQLLEQA